MAGRSGVLRDTKSTNGERSCSIGWFVFSM